MNYTRKNNKLTNNVKNIGNVLTCNGVMTKLSTIVQYKAGFSKRLPSKEEYRTLTLSEVSIVLVSIM